MDSIDIVRKQVWNSAYVKNLLLENEAVIARIAQVADLCTEAYRNGKKTLFAGNGGSAADAQHLPPLAMIVVISRFLLVRYKLKV